MRMGEENGGLEWCGPAGGVDLQNRGAPPAPSGVKELVLSVVAQAMPPPVALQGATTPCRDRFWG